MPFTFWVHFSTYSIVLYLPFTRTTLRMPYTEQPFFKTENKALDGQSSTTAELEFGWYSIATTLALWFAYAIVSIFGCCFKQAPNKPASLSRRDYLTISFMFSNVTLLTCTLNPTDLITEGDEYAFVTNAVCGFLLALLFATVHYMTTSYIIRSKVKSSFDKEKSKKSRNSKKSQKKEQSLGRVWVVYLSILVSFTFGGTALILGTYMDDESSTTWFYGFMIVMALKLFVLMPTVRFVVQHRAAKTEEKAQKQATKSISHEDLKDEIKVEVRRSIVEAKKLSSIDIKRSSSHGSQDSVSRISAPGAPEGGFTISKMDEGQQVSRALEPVDGKKSPSNESTGEHFYHDVVQKSGAVRSFSQYGFSSAKRPEATAKVEQQPAKPRELQRTASQSSGREYPMIRTKSAGKSLSLQMVSKRLPVKEPNAQVQGIELKRTPSRLSTGSDYYEHLVHGGKTAPVRSISQYSGLGGKITGQPPPKASPQSVNLTEVKRSPSQLSTGSDYYQQLMLGGKTAKIRSISQYGALLQRPKY